MFQNINIAYTLKELRKISHLSAKDAADQLKPFGINISSKTLYGYESSLSMPNADTFVALCKIYGCENPMQIASNENKTPLESAAANTRGVDIEVIFDAVCKLGLMQEGDTLSDSDLRFLLSIGECLKEWFSHHAE